MVEKKPCPNCATPILAEATDCPHCGEKFEARPPAPAPARSPLGPMDAEHLRLLGIFHYVLGGLTGLFACFPLIHVALGAVMLLAPESLDSHGNGPPRLVGVFFLLIGGGFVLVGWTIAGAMLYAGRALSKRKHYVFCLMVAGACCLMMPLGTILGVFTFIVLLRPAVKEQFD
jgi:hypothetical protein